MKMKMATRRMRKDMMRIRSLTSLKEMMLVCLLMVSMMKMIRRLMLFGKRLTSEWIRGGRIGEKLG